MLYVGYNDLDRGHIYTLMERHHPDNDMLFAVQFVKLTHCISLIQTCVHVYLIKLHVYVDRSVMMMVSA
jgi:hypothetical protein